MRSVQSIVASIERSKVAVVVSAMGGKPKVTDMLLSLVELAKTNESAAIQSIVQKIEAKHAEVIAALLPPAVGSPIMDSIRHDLRTLEELLRAISIMRSYNENVTDLVSGHGELWSAQIMTQVLNEHMIANDRTERFAFIDARDVLIVKIDPNHGPVVQYEKTRANLNARMAALKNSTHLVITGFICSTPDGMPFNHICDSLSFDHIRG